MTYSRKNTFTTTNDLTLIAHRMQFPGKAHSWSQDTSSGSKLVPNVHILSVVSFFVVSQPTDVETGPQQFANQLWIDVRADRSGDLAI